MIIALLVWLLGGSWKLKERCSTASPPLFRRPLALLWRLWLIENNSSIDAASVFANRPCLPHGIKGIFVSGDVRVGRNCVIFQQVIIGSNYLPGTQRLGAPRIGDNCYIGAGARIIGGIRIGDNCRIGAGCVVFDDMPDNSVALTASPRIIQRTEIMKNRHYSLKKDTWRYYVDGDWVTETNESIILLLEQARKR